MIPIFTFTDFGPGRLYSGQVHAVFERQAPGCPVIDLMDDAPGFDVQAGAHLLAALVRRLTPPAVVLAVVDPGVGGDRRARAVAADGRWLVGPDNGLFDVVCADAAESAAFEILWRPSEMSNTFHGRDLFAPVAAMLAREAEPPPMAEIEYQRRESDPQRVIYIDAYGNCMTGLRANRHGSLSRLRIGKTLCPRFERFEQAVPGQLFCYRNSLDLLEIAANLDSAAAILGARVGDRVELLA